MSVGTDEKLMGREGRELLMSIFDGLGFEDLNKEQCDPQECT